MPCYLIARTRDTRQHPVLSHCSNETQAASFFSFIKKCVHLTLSTMLTLAVDSKTVSIEAVPED
jgi:hypothetical protein